MTPLLLPYLALLSLHFPWSTSFTLPTSSTAYIFTLLLYTFLFKRLFKSIPPADEEDQYHQGRFLPNFNFNLVFFWVNVGVAAWRGMNGGLWDAFGGGEGRMDVSALGVMDLENWMSV